MTPADPMAPPDTVISVRDVTKRFGGFTVFSQYPAIGVDDRGIVWSLLISELGAGQRTVVAKAVIDSGQIVQDHDVRTAYLADATVHRNHKAVFDSLSRCPGMKSGVQDALFHGQQAITNFDFLGDAGDLQFRNLGGMTAE